MIWIFLIPVALLASLFVSMKILYVMAIVGVLHWLFRLAIRRELRKNV